MDIKGIIDKVKAAVSEASSRLRSLASEGRQCLVRRFAAFRERDYTFRDAIFLFLVAVALGAGCKVWAGETFTIGYQDYQLRPAETLIDINALQKEMVRQGRAMSVSGASSGPSCAQ